MSIVDEREQRVYPVPKADHFADKRTQKTKLRDARWLTVKRTLKLTVRELAKFLNEKDVAKVDKAVRNARLAEQAAKSRRDAGAGGMNSAEAWNQFDEEDLAHFQRTYPKGTVIGDDPRAQRFFANLQLSQPSLADLKSAGKRHRPRHRVSEEGAD